MSPTAQNSAPEQLELDFGQLSDLERTTNPFVEGCERARAEEIAELAVDLTIVALQLAAPYLDTRSMARLDARRGTRQKRTLSEANGQHWMGWTRKEPGMVIGAGTLPDILRESGASLPQLLGT